MDESFTYSAQECNGNCNEVTIGREFVKRLLRENRGSRGANDCGANQSLQGAILIFGNRRLALTLRHVKRADRFVCTFDFLTIFFRLRFCRIIRSKKKKKKKCDDCRREMRRNRLSRGERKRMKETSALPVRALANAAVTGERNVLVKL